MPRNMGVYGGMWDSCLAECDTWVITCTHAYSRLWPYHLSLLLPTRHPPPLPCRRGPSRLLGTCSAYAPLATCSASAPSPPPRLLSLALSNHLSLTAADYNLLLICEGVSGDAGTIRDSCGSSASLHSLRLSPPRKNVPRRPSTALLRLLQHKKGAKTKWISPHGGGQANTV